MIGFNQSFYLIELFIKLRHLIKIVNQENALNS